MKPDFYIDCLEPEADNPKKHTPPPDPEPPDWTDDALVASEIIEKFWAKVPGIYICIEEVVP